MRALGRDAGRHDDAEQVCGAWRSRDKAERRVELAAGWHARQLAGVVRPLLDTAIGREARSTGYTAIGSGKQADGGRQVVVSRRDLPGVVPMLRHYLRGAPKPAFAGTYNPLQKLAYTVVAALLLLQALSGLALWRPAQLSLLVTLFGGFQGVRLVHFVAMCALLAFVPLHLLMVALAGWRNLKRMVVGFDTAVSDSPPEG